MGDRVLVGTGLVIEGRTLTTGTHLGYGTIYK